MATTTKKVRSKSDHVAINLGLEVLHPRPDEPSKSSTKFDFDIVAIPGLGANPEWTWKYGKTVHWLRDSNMLPKKIPNARISVLHYESQWYGKDPIDQKLENVVDQLLYALERSRGHDCKAPIIFVCHCFGGIVLEQALLTAKLRQNDFPSVFPWVVGSIFLGTPFNGTKTQSKGMLLAGIASVWGGAVQSSLLKLLEKDSETLKRTLHDFVRLSTEAQIRVFCFFEGEKSDVVGLVVKGFAKELMVDKESATYPGVECLQLALDHFALNKYSGPKDGNFISVSNEIKVTASRAANVIKSRQNANRQALIGDRTYHAIIDALGKGFSDIDAAMKGTFQYPKATEKEKPGDQMTTKNSWVVLKDSYKNWKEQHTSQLLWVHGRAGTGQDTIASSVIDSLQKSAKDLDEKPDERSDEAGPIVASFFCDQGDEKRRTLLGLLKLIVRQIIDRNQDLAVHLLTDSKKGKKGSAQDFDNESLSKVSFLWDGLQAMARDLSFGCIYIIIYGLDLLSQDSLAEFLQFTDDISAACVPPESDVQSNPIKWMVLSRSSRPNIEKALKHKALEINLDDSENSVHVKDELKERISAMVDELGLVASLAYFVKRHIHSRAEGNAIYVLLVIQELKNAQESGKASYVEFRALLESLPYGLTELYEHIRGRVLKPESEGIEYTKEILRCMILSQETPSMRELAVIAGLPREHWEEYATLKAHIIRCGAFLTIRGSNLAEDTNTVGWVDMSAKEHLEHYSQDDLGLDLKDMHHGIIALRCLEYLYERHEKSEDAKTINQAIEEDPDDSREGNSSYFNTLSHTFQVLQFGLPFFGQSRAHWSNSRYVQLQQEQASSGFRSFPFSFLTQRSC
ncbi:hypothetical protein BU16DRAFT_93807 [Lophium mytilinum]|uniref:Nephrocystin 3-like N-terminal domain-containing protein n=1 Tax=Lophium mytilinum TaxID=390894 RepID=A0A6A6QKV1_9PEZI|nr:hypothetical protein BU16DRAFT_93807 [Lophium mytilinum]